MGDVTDLAAFRDGWVAPPRPEPILHPVPDVVRGIVLRVDLTEVEPSIWRRIVVPSDVTLARLHDVVQAAMGWTNSHLHRFRTGEDPGAASFPIGFEDEEPATGPSEDEVRVDQLLAEEGDRLWYAYDFGDGWEHVITVEDVLPEPPVRAGCLAGELACPPEDCGGAPGYAELAAWARSGWDDAAAPSWGDGPAQLRAWLPPAWDPDRFEPGAADADVAAAAGEPIEVGTELAALQERLASWGIVAVWRRLAGEAMRGRTEISEDEAARLTAPYRLLLEVVGDGVTLTGAGYLPPRLVEHLSARTGVLEWWFGKGNREDLTWPIGDLCRSARTLGLLTVRKSRLTATAVGARLRDSPLALWRHIVARLPLGTRQAEREAGWMALVVAAEEPENAWRDEIGDLLHLLGWRRADAPWLRPPVASPTLDVLGYLHGTILSGRPAAEVDPAVAATARAVITRHA